MTEPVTAHTRSFTRAVWSLDRDLAYARHYPAVSWRESFSRDGNAIADWYATNGDPAWHDRHTRALALLAKADRLQEIAELVGTSALPDRERLVLLVARLLREGALQQNALVPNDATSSPAKTSALIELVFAVHDAGSDLLGRHVPISLLEEADLSDAFRARLSTPRHDADGLREIRDRIVARIEALQ